MLRSRLTDALKTAMKSRDDRTVSTVRDIEARAKGNMSGIGDDEMLQMMQGMIKQRRESIELYEKGGRHELAQKEKDEIAVIESFMPRQLSGAELEAAVKAAIGEVGASSVKDMGKVMARLKERHAGTMDFAKASGIVKAQLG